MNVPAPRPVKSTRGYSADLGFRLGTGVFAVALVLIVVAIGFELSRQSMLSIQKFGLHFWAHANLGSGRRRVRRLAVHLGHAVLVDPRAAAWRRRWQSASPSSSPSCRPGWLRQPLVFITELLAAIPSIVYGLWGIFVMVPGGSRARGRLAGVVAPTAALHRPALRRRDALGGADPRDHGHPVHLVGRARSPEGRAGGPARRRLRARGDAVRGHPRGALLCPHRHRRLRHAGLRACARRDDGRHDGDRQQPADLDVALRSRSTPWRRSSPTSSRRRRTSSISPRSSRSASSCS